MTVESLSDQKPLLGINTIKLKSSVSMHFLRHNKFKEQFESTVRINFATHSYLEWNIDMYIALQCQILDKFQPYNEYIWFKVIICCVADSAKRLISFIY